MKTNFPNSKPTNSETKLLTRFAVIKVLDTEYLSILSLTIFLCGMLAFFSPNTSFAENSGTDKDSSKTFSFMQNSPVSTSQGSGIKISTRYAPQTDSIKESFPQAHSLTPSTVRVAPLHGIWGKIVDSPSGTDSPYCEKDLVYIRCSDTKRGLLREGDRFGIVANSTDPSLSRPCGSFSDVQSRILGRIEITSVGADLILGIIVECRAVIRNGYQITPIPQTAVELPSHLEAEAISSMDGHTS